jgi:phosphoglycolate phosphatase
MSKIVFGERAFEAELVIFDKDGTLNDFETTWVPLFETRVQCILENLSPAFPVKAVKDELYRVFGIASGSIDPNGPFVFSSLREDETIVATVLYKHGMPWQKAKQIAGKSAQDAEKAYDRPKNTHLISGVREVLLSLHTHGVLLAIATADITKIAIDILKQLGIDGLFDIVVGSDQVKRDKPDPETIEAVLSHLGKQKERAAFVGDTATDMEMGRRAGVGLVVGVTEGGVTPREELELVANVVIDSIRKIRIAKK